MKKSKLLAVLLIIAMITVMIAGCSGKDDPKDTGVDSEPKTTEAQDSGGDKFKALLLINGSLGDKGFFDNAASGLYRLRDELGCEIKIVEMGLDETTYEGYFLDESEKDWDIIITGTFSVKDLLEDIALQFPDQKYLGFDISIDFEKVNTKNIMGVTYKSNETGFMGGSLAALMFESGDAKVDKNSPILGFVGSMDVPNINDFLVGYIDGIKYINPDLKLLTSYVGSFSDVPKCLEMSTQLYNQGAQIVYAPASQSILGAVQASKDKDKFFVACDNDIWTMLEGNDPDLVANILSSTMKNVGDSIFLAVKGMIEGNYHVGENYLLGIGDGAVGLAKNSNYESLVPADIRARLDEIADKLANGEIEVTSAFNMKTEDVAKLRDDMKP